ncbi:TadE family protein [Occallatibacter savannae]|uniref:TadE family protein n=1 Tax=Occallatibacter savannae TaxID=1002691 RepID=UPI000D68655C|nr:TadE family protein [Occallatibacter savannae]
MKRLIWDESGGPLVELALAMPLLTAILLGAIGLGQLAMGAINVSNAAKAAVQYAAQDSGTAVDTATMLSVAKADIGNTIGQTGTLDMPKPLGLPSVASCVSTGTSPKSYSCSYCQCSSPNASVAPFACSTADPNTACGVNSTSQLEQVIVVSTHINMRPVAAIPGLPVSFDMYGNATEKRLQ